MRITLAVVYACSGTHNLNISGGNDPLVHFTVAMFQLSFQRNGYNLHVFVGMSIKARFGGNDVIIQYPQRTKSHFLGIVIVAKAKAMITSSHS